VKRPGPQSLPTAAQMEDPQVPVSAKGSGRQLPPSNGGGSSPLPPLASMHGSKLPLCCAGFDLQLRCLNSTQDGARAGFTVRYAVPPEQNAASLGTCLGRFAMRADKAVVPGRGVKPDVVPSRYRLVHVASTCQTLAYRANPGRRLLTSFGRRSRGWLW
jgi:hypothetical protein